MKKLIFYYSAMNGGKSTALIQVAYNYEANNQKIVLVKSKKDTKAGNYLSARNGQKRKVDIILDSNDTLLSAANMKLISKSNCILVDEAQLLEEKQIEELFYLTKEKDIPVICYGLKTDFRSKLFAGSKRLIELADEIEELSTIPLCSCGVKARFNARKINGKYTLDGEQVSIDDGSVKNQEYVPLCGKCYYEKVLQNKIS